MVFNKILRLGFELEGGFINEVKKEDSKIRKEFINLLKKLKFIKDFDGSINSSSDYHALELKSRIYEIKNRKDLKKVIEDFKKISEYMKEVNSSMGIHFHISFKNLSDYYTLLNFDFADRFIKKYKENFKSKIERDRLLNHYCKIYEDEKDFKNSTKQALRCMGKGFRYKAINYNAYNCYKTIEFRLFSSTKEVKKFKDYITFLYDYVINYLKEDDDGLIKKDLIVKKRKFNKETEDEKIIITEDEINENEFLNYIDRKKDEKEKRESDETTLNALSRIHEEEENNEDEGSYFVRENDEDDIDTALGNELRQRGIV